MDELKPGDRVRVTGPDGSAQRNGTGRVVSAGAVCEVLLDGESRPRNFLPENLTRE